MNSKLQQALYNDFYIFLRKAFGEIHPTKEFRKYPYIEYMCQLAASVESGDITRLNLNIPPRHLKTFLFSKAFPAWLFGRHPALEIMVLTGNEPLAKDIPYSIRAIMQMDWYKDSFPTRIAVDRSRVLDFATTAGGVCFTSPIGGSFAGRGADYVVVDDAIDIKNAGDAAHLADVNEFFDSGVLSRLNDPRRSRIVVVGHRVNENDLSGHILKQGGWTNVALPLVASSRTKYKFGEKIGRRERNELLQINSRTKEELGALRRNTVLPDFDTLYQQNPIGELTRRITAQHFPSVDREPVSNVAVVLSVDPGQEISATSSFSVIQAWCRQGDRHFLIDQWREQVEFRELLSMCRKFRQRYQARAVLIERAALGTPLISEGKRRDWKGLVSLVPDGRSKVARLRPHVDLIRKGRVVLPADVNWRDEFIQELIAFPNGPFMDQVDAMTQYLDWSKNRRELTPAPPRAIIAVAGSRGLPFSRRR